MGTSTAVLVVAFKKGPRLVEGVRQVLCPLHTGNVAYALCVFSQLHVCIHTNNLSVGARTTAAYTIIINTNMPLIMATIAQTFL